MRKSLASLSPTIIAVLVLAAGLAVGAVLWRDWGLVVFFKGGGLLC